MSILSRILILGSALLLSLTYYFPLWEIALEAPQYPEGLGIEIWINQMQGQNPGDIAKINNLNHYIGMKTIHPESIKELTVMPWIMPGLMLFGIIVAITGKRRLLLFWLAVFVVIAVAGLVDYYLWGYDYGHNLDMNNAIIKVPGMTYQPPLIGSKKLLNFTAYSWPGVAGWIAISMFFVSMFVYIREYKRSIKLSREKSNEH